MLRGKGDNSEFIMGGTAARPLSDAVCVSMVMTLFVSVAASSCSNFSRSIDYGECQRRVDRWRARTGLRLRLPYFRIDHPISR